MSIYANAKLRTKLLAGFIIVSLLAAVTGIVGYVNIHSMMNINTLIKDTYIVMNSRLVEFNNNMRDVRVYIRSVALLKDDGMMRENSDRLQQAQDALHESVTGMRELVSQDDKETLDLINAFEGHFNEYIELKDETMPLINTHDQALIDQGVDAIFGPDFSRASNDMVDALSKITDRIRTLTNEATANQTAIQAQADLLIIVTAVVAVIIGVALGLLIAGNTAKSVKSISAVVDKVAAGDFTVEVDMHNKSELGHLADRVNTMIENLRQVLNKVNEVALVVDDTSRQVASSSMSLAQISTEQAGSAQEISASMIDITNRTRTNSDNANKATGISDSTSHKAAQGSDRMNEMLNAMQSINDSSANISNIIKVIDDIAFQTNILALNAAVEAARAGSHGKGFAVVAEEVRNLAARSATAASETTNMIENSIKEVENGTVIARETAESLKEIVKGVADTAELLKSISEASRKQSEEAAQISSGMDQVSQAIQTTSSVAEEAASSSSELEDQSATLKELVSKFQFQAVGAGSMNRVITQKPTKKVIAAAGSGAVGSSLGGEENPRAYATYASVSSQNVAAGGETAAYAALSGGAAGMYKRGAGSVGSGSDDGGERLYGNVPKISLGETQYGKY